MQTMITFNWTSYDAGPKIASLRNASKSVIDPRVTSRSCVLGPHEMTGAARDDACHKVGPAIVNVDFYLCHSTKGYKPIVTKEMDP